MEYHNNTSSIRTEKMADGMEYSEFERERKRPRLELRLNSEGDECEFEHGSLAEVEFTSGHSNSETAMTSDSGYNEISPSRSTDDECSNRPLEKDSESGQEQSPTEENSMDSNFSESSCSEDVLDCPEMSAEEQNIMLNRATKWLTYQFANGGNPRAIFRKMCPEPVEFPEGTEDNDIWQVLFGMVTEKPKRNKLEHINTIEDAVQLIKSSKKIIVLTGAGISVSCGIPDFRSKDGVYARLAVDFPLLPDPQSMFDINYFKSDFRPFFKFAKDLFPGQYIPSLSHKFIKAIEDQGNLLRNYTQNIDTLERSVGLQRIVECHGSFATASCMRCKNSVDSNTIKEQIFSEQVPFCTVCTDPNSEDPYSIPEPVREPVFEKIGGAPHCVFDSLGFHRPVMKPDIVFFGESLSSRFHDTIAEDDDSCDLLIVIGSTMTVQPVCSIPFSVPPNVPQILINREPLKHMNFDVELLGNADEIVAELCKRLGGSYKDLVSGDLLEHINELPPKPSETPPPKDEDDIDALRACWESKHAKKESIATRLPDGTFHRVANHRYIFKGAEYYPDSDTEDNSNETSFSSDSSSASNEDV